MGENREKAEELLSKMTLKEKVGQLAQKPFGFNAYTRDENGEIVLTEEFKSYVKEFGGIGMLYGFFRADPWSNCRYDNGGIVASEREKAYNILQKYVKITYICKKSCDIWQNILQFYWKKLLMNYLSSLV